ncbi:hypothetical protein SMF913_13212 [Streptomyces malaysiensis]|uniref:Uncharacterized protein n=1 Tax=Streptomyces malaysiensis TaxID=92644 RepID=A0A2J7ZA85_STRMQ|nr:hypothetical protein SMF913_13212 [Streptomyces malaysiensis]
MISAVAVVLLDDRGSQPWIRHIRVPATAWWRSCFWTTEDRNVKFCMAEQPGAKWRLSFGTIEGRNTNLGSALFPV